MIRYLTSILAVIIAVGAVAFTKPENKINPLATKIFQYQAPTSDPYSETNVESRSNWVITNLGSTTCSQVNQEACQLLVDATDINPDNTLKSTFTILTTMSAPNVYYVSGGSATAIYNKN
ncbi:MAG TPA: hypothetical protein VIJ95_08170 [Hanamia sp.]